MIQVIPQTLNVHPSCHMVDRTAIFPLRPHALNHVYCGKLFMTAVMNNFNLGPIAEYYNRTYKNLMLHTTLQSAM